MKALRTQAQTFTRPIVSFLAVLFFSLPLQMKGQNLTNLNNNVKQKKLSLHHSLKTNNMETPTYKTRTAEVRERNDVYFLTLSWYEGEELKEVNKIFNNLEEADTEANKFLRNTKTKQQ